MAKGLSKKVQLSLDVKQIIIGILLIAIAVMLVLWKPWHSSVASDRTVKVTGEATVKAEPDEYVFYPNYQFKNTNKEAALAELTKKSTEVIAKLKELGVDASKIKTNANGNDYIYYTDIDNSTVYTLSLTINVGSKDAAQKIQDYLTTTQPTGNVSPQTTFSQAKRKELEARARDEATKDARKKADQSASNLGFKISNVKSVEDGAGFGEAMPMIARGGVAMDSSAPATTTLDVVPGENEVHYNVTVIYFVR